MIAIKKYISSFRKIDMLICLTMALFFLTVNSDGHACRRIGKVYFNNHTDVRVKVVIFSEKQYSHNKKCLAEGKSKEQCRVYTGGKREVLEIPAKTTSSAACWYNVDYYGGNMTGFKAYFRYNGEYVEGPEGEVKEVKCGLTGCKSCIKKHKGRQDYIISSGCDDKSHVKCTVDFNRNRQTD